MQTLLCTCIDVIDKQNYPMAARIIKDTLIAGKIKEENTENKA